MYHTGSHTRHTGRDEYGKGGTSRTSRNVNRWGSTLEVFGLFWCTNVSYVMGYISRELLYESIKLYPGFKATCILHLKYELHVVLANIS